MGPSNLFTILLPSSDIEPERLPYITDEASPKPGGLEIADKEEKMIRRLIVVLTAVAMAAAAATQKMPEKADEGLPIKGLIRALELGKPLEHGGLTIIPVHMGRVQDRISYVTLEEALRSGWLLISEVDGGRVPQVMISNLSKQTIFLMSGEILTGCRQDRILAQDILLAPGTKNLLAPVFCVEHGRWHQTSSGFTSKQNLGTPALRATAQKKSPAAQAEIWERIALDNRKMDIGSTTDAYQDAYEKEEVRAAILGIEKKIKNAPFLQDDTLGVIIGIGGELASVDIFANPGLFAKQWPKILKSSALSSLYGSKGISLSREKAAGFLRSFMDQTYSTQSGLDLGTEYTSSEADVNIRALAYKGGIIHLSGFPQEKDRLKVVR
jgi:hypothetical protein